MPCVGRLCPMCSTAVIATASLIQPSLETMKKKVPPHCPHFH